MLLHEVKESGEAIKLDKAKLSKLIDDNIRTLFDIYKKHGYELRIVGGAVRDILMNKIPKDIDLSSPATPQKSKEILEKNNIKIIETGMQHGTITAVFNNIPYEITTLRIDTQTDGRHATVEFTNDWKLDAERRDLTFNSMSIDANGYLYDYFGGYEDLKNGVAKFVGNSDKRIQEDYLRILRYFRFQGRLSSPKFEKDILDSISNNASGLKDISGERIWAELKNILSGKNVTTVVKAMMDTGVLDSIGLHNISLQELDKVSKNTNNPLSLFVSMLISDEFKSAKNRLKFSNDEYKFMEFIISNKDKDISLQKAKILHTLNNVDKNYLKEMFIYKGDKKLADEISKWQAPTFPITGNDLINHGINPGPQFGKIIKELKVKWVQSDFQLTKEQLLSTIAVKESHNLLLEKEMTTVVSPKVYHATTSEFDEFKPDFVGRSGYPDTKYGEAYFFSTDLAAAAGIASSGLPDEEYYNLRYKTAKLTFKNAMVFDSDKWGDDATSIDSYTIANLIRVAKERGFDGVVYKNKSMGDVYVAFNPSQIKIVEKDKKFI